jgi:hypothetical protein
MAVVVRTRKATTPLLAPWRGLFSRNAEMTKAELIEALVDLPNDAEVLIEAWPYTGNRTRDLAAFPSNGELYAIKEADLIPAEGDNAAFLTLKPETEVKPLEPCLYDR